MNAPVGLRSQYSQLYGEGMLPVLEDLFMYEIEQNPSQRDRLFRVRATDRDIWQSSSLHDLSLLKQIDEGTEYTFTRPRQGAAKTYTVQKFGLGFSISEEMVDDGRFDLIADMTRKLAKSARESQEIAAFSIFNNGFTTETSDDGLSVFNAAHLLPGGGTYRNRLLVDSDLSVTSLDAALADFETQFVGDSGIIYSPKPRFLVVHPSQKRYAMELIGSDLKADTADNNMNSFKQDGLVVISSPHLTDPDAWFLVGAPEDTGLNIISRSPIETMAAGKDAGFTTDSIMYKVRYREAIGVSTAIGIIGSPGA